MTRAVPLPTTLRRLALAAALSGCISTPALAADFIVTSNAEKGDGSLSEAVSLANRSPGTDRISFELAPAQARIPFVESLLEITDTVEINGWIAPLTAGQQPTPVEFVAPKGAWPNGLFLGARAKGSLISGVKMTGFASAVSLDGCHHCKIDGVQIGGDKGRIGIHIRNSSEVTLGAQHAVEIEGMLIGIYCEHSPELFLQNVSIRASRSRLEESNCRGTHTTPAAPADSVAMGRHDTDAT